MSRTTDPADRPVTRDDIEAKLREIRGEVDDVAEASRGYIVAAGAVVVLVAIGAAFVLGRRKGRKRATVVEVRRV
jgi:hypothetical protein